MRRYKEIILDIVTKSQEHLTAEEIFLKLKAEESKAVLATVYNNLNALCSEGLIRKVSLEGMPDRYDRVMKHDHLCCRICGKLSDICFQDLTKNLEQQMGEAIISYDLKVFYVCPECKKNTKQ